MNQSAKRDGIYTNLSDAQHVGFCEHVVGRSSARLNHVQAAKSLLVRPHSQKLLPKFGLYYT